MLLKGLNGSLRCTSLRFSKSISTFSRSYDRNQVNYTSFKPIHLIKRSFLNWNPFSNRISSLDFEKQFELLNSDKLRELKKSIEYKNFDNISEHEFKLKYNKNLFNQLEEKFKIKPAGLISICDDLFLKDAFLFYNSISGEFLKCNRYNFLNTLLELKYNKWLRDKYQINRFRDSENLVRKVMRLTSIAKLKSPTVEAFNLLLYFYSLDGNLNYSQQIFNLMHDFKFSPNELSYSLLLNAYASQKNTDKTTKLFIEMIEKNLINSSLPYSVFVKLNVLNGRPDKASHNINFMKERIQPPSNLLNLLIDSYIQNNQISNAWQVYDDMKRNKGQINELTFKLMLGACIKSSEFHKVLVLLDDVENQQENCNVLEILLEFFNTLAKYPNHFKFYTKR